MFCFLFLVLSPFLLFVRFIFIFCFVMYKKVYKCMGSIVILDVILANFYIISVYRAYQTNEKMLRKRRLKLTIQPVDFSITTIFFVFFASQLDLMRRQMISRLHDVGFSSFYFLFLFSRSHVIGCGIRYRLRRSQEKLLRFYIFTRFIRYSRVQRVSRTCFFFRFGWMKSCLHV